MRSLRLALLVAAVPLLTASAQSIPLLTRITPSTGLADSSLFLCVDSTKTLTRACKFSDLQKRLAYKTFDSLVTGNIRITGTCTGCGAADPSRLANNTAAAPAYSFTNSTGLGLYRYGADTLGFSNGGVHSLLLRAQTTGNSRRVSMAVGLSGAADSSQFQLNMWRAGSTVGAFRVNEATQLLVNGQANAARPPFAFIGDSTNGFGNMNGAGMMGWYSSGAERVRFTTTQLLSVANGTAAAPAFSFTGSTGLGLYSFGTDTLGFATGGVHSLRISGGANPTISGGAGDLRINAGTGASRVLTLGVTNSGSSQIALVTVAASGGLMRMGLGGAANNPAFSSFQGQSGMYFASGTSDSIMFSTSNTQMFVMTGAGSAKLTGGAGNMTILAGTGNSRTLTVQATDGSGNARTSFVAIDSQFQAPNGRVAKPSISFVNATNYGFMMNGSSQLDIVGGGVSVLGITGQAAQFSRSIGIDGPGTDTVTFGSASLLLGGGGDMTLLAGTGNNRSLVLRSSNSTGTATTFATGSGDTLKFAGRAIATAFTAAAGTPGSICYNTATSELTKNAATSCVVSSRRFKEGIAPLSLAEASRITNALRPSTFTYRDGKRKAIGLIAEEADSVDARLASRDNAGRVTSVNYEQIAVALLAVVKDQQRQLDSIKTAIRRKP